MPDDIPPSGPRATRLSVAQPHTVRRGNPMVGFALVVAVTLVGAALVSTFVVLAHG